MYLSIYQLSYVFKGDRYCQDLKKINTRAKCKNVNNLLSLVCISALHKNTFKHFLTCDK